MRQRVDDSCWSLQVGDQAVFINPASREINLRLIYIGLPSSGKVESLQYIYDATAADSRGDMVSVAREMDTTISFDFVPNGLAKIRGYSVRVHLYSLAGTEEPPASARSLVQGADGVIFVARCQDWLEANVHALELVKSAIHDQGRDWSRLPRVIQLTDGLSNPLLAAETARALALGGEPTILTDSHSGTGVFDALRAGIKELLLGMRDGRVQG